MKNINLIRKIAWMFHNKTGIEFEDLFSEASLGYCEALQSFSSNKTANLSTFAWNWMNRKLIDYCRKEHIRKKHHGFYLSALDDQDDNMYYVLLIFKKISNPPNQLQPPTIPEYQFLPRDCKLIIHLILSNFDELYQLPPTKARNIITAKLKEIGWKHDRIYWSMNRLKKYIKEI